MSSPIQRRGRLYVVIAASGETEHASFEAAQAYKRQVDILEHARREKDPNVLKRRQEKAAYRLVERDPYLKALKGFLPRSGEIERTTRATYERSLKFVGAHMSIASSDPQLHAELNKTPGQRRVSKAKKARDQKGADRRDQIAARWGALADVPERKRASIIAAELHIDPRHVRRLRPR